jgi:hypothetical protein
VGIFRRADQVSSYSSYSRTCLIIALSTSRLDFGVVVAVIATANERYSLLARGSFFGSIEAAKSTTPKGLPFRTMAINFYDVRPSIPITPLVELLTSY